MLVAQSLLSLLQVRRVSEWFSAVTGGTMCFAIVPSHKLSGHKLTQIMLVKRFFFQVKCQQCRVVIAIFLQTKLILCHGK